MASIGKVIVICGLIIAACGFIIWVAPSVPILNRFGRLPGDILVRRGNFTFYFPVVTSIAISLLLTLIFAMLRL
jgi:hypothetical protein